MSETYRQFHLLHEMPPIPTRAYDWCAYHDDYDGAPDAHDHRVFRGPTKEDVMAQVDEWYEETEEATGMRTIPFTQYLLPRGERREGGFEVAADVFAKAQTIIDAGHRFEAEILTTGHVSLTIHNVEAEEDVAIELVPNGPGVREAVCRLVEGFAPSPTDTGDGG